MKGLDTEQLVIEDPPMSTDVFSLQCDALEGAKLASFKGVEGLSRPFEFDVFFTVPVGTDVKSAVGAPGHPRGRAPWCLMHDERRRHMKINQSCPKCDCSKLWVIDRVRHRHPGSTGKTVAMPVTAAIKTDGTESFLSAADYVELGTFEAWICTQCGYTEWYARNVNEGLANMLDNPKAGIRLVEKVGDRGPFR